MSLSETTPPATFSLPRWLRLTCAIAVVAVLGLLFYLFGVQEILQGVILRLRTMGPVIFFCGMAVLPALGFPMLFFTLAAGPTFGPTLGPAWVVIWSVSALIFNLVFSYVLALWARPLVAKCIQYLGYRIPEVRADSSWQVVTIVRLTPGPPYWVQCYILGLLKVAFVPYVVMSTFVVALYIVGLVYGGDALMRGHGRTVFFALMGLGLVGAGFHLYRKCRKTPSA